MASLRREIDRNRTGWRLQFRQSGKRRSLWIGDVSKRVAETVSRHVEELARAASANCPPAADSAKWLQGVDGRIHETLVRWGLAESRQEFAEDLRLCAGWFEHYTASRTDLKEHTRTMYRQSATWFANRFGKDKTLAAVTQGDFEGWIRWMADGRLSQATANKHGKRVKRMFREAVKHRLLLESPAEGTRIGGEHNPARQFYVSPEAARSIIEQCDTEWALIFGLARYAGLRAPSEILALTWSDVHWAENRLRIDSVKTGLRYCPVFPELRPLLDNAYEAARDGTKHVISRYRGSETNLRSQLHRITERAGMKPWPKTFVNLRSSCRTDLEERFAGHVIDQWLGHSSAVAKKHYLQVTDAHWERAIAGGVTGGVVSAGQTAPPAVSETETARNAVPATLRRLVTDGGMPPQGLEPWTH